MASEHLPAITLTDPNNDPASPSPALSPTKDAPRDAFPPTEVGGSARNDFARPSTPSRKPGNARPDSSNGNTWTSPSRLIRTLSSSNGNFSGPSWDEILAKKDSEPEAPPPIMDPLSQHILKRTNAPVPTTTAPKPVASESSARDDTKAGAEQTSSAPAVQPLKKVDTNDSLASQTLPQKELRKGVKAVSFISRLMGSKKKDETDVAGDNESVSNEGRPEGMDAEVFTQPVDNVGFSPRQPQPPSYIKVRSKHKRVKEFDRVFLAQELECRNGRKLQQQGSSNKLRRKGSQPHDGSTVWAMEFSRDGKYMAAAGEDGVVRVWAVLSNSEERQKHEKQESTESEANGAGAHTGHLSAPVFQSEPIQEYEGHSSSVLSLSWSKNNFLLSSSMDKTVRLWHVSRAACLCTFKHADFVPSIAFHPKDDRFFLAGSLDSKLRLWSIPDKSVAYLARLPDMITAVGFTPDGKHAMAGCLSGLCMFYETEGLKYQSQMSVKSSRGQNAKGSKITGMHAYHDRRGDVKLLVTSNDSRTRLYNFRDKNLELKFRGNENNSSQIRASVNDDAQYIVCGSEDRKAYIWSTGPGEGDKRDKRPVEFFEAHDTIATVVAFAPTKTRQWLSKSEDPVYDLCNPPAVTLLSRAERTESQSSSRPPTENGSIQATPADYEGRFERPKESPSYITKSTHKCGNIIVTADFTGRIKVFRQDCAWQKRRDDWDRSSIFSKRTGRLSRTGSTMTRESQPSLREGRTSLSMSGPSDRILSWRQSITSSAGVNDGQRRRSSKNESGSVSPRRSVDQRGSQGDISSDAARKTSEPANGKWTGWATNVNTNPASLAEMRIDTTKARGAVDAADRGSQGSGSPRSIREENPLLLSGGRSYMFWDTEGWKGRAERMKHHKPDVLPLSPVVSRDDTGMLRPNLERGTTAVSELSDERSSARSSMSEVERGSEDNDAGPSEGVGGRKMQCKNCGCLSFTARRLNEGGTVLVCTKCGTRG